MTTKPEYILASLCLGDYFQREESLVDPNDTTGYATELNQDDQTAIPYLIPITGPRQ